MGVPDNKGFGVDVWYGHAMEAKQTKTKYPSEIYPPEQFCFTVALDANAAAATKLKGEPLITEEMRGDIAAKIAAVVADRIENFCSLDTYDDNFNRRVILRGSFVLNKAKRI